MVLVFWIVLLSVFLGFFSWATNLLKTEAEGERFDAGLAILEFGRAYPDEAIRLTFGSLFVGFFFLAGVVALARAWRHGSTLRRSVILIFSPANMASRCSVTPRVRARCTSSLMVSSSARFLE